MRSASPPAGSFCVLSSLAFAFFASQQSEKTNAEPIANAYIELNKYSPSTPIVKVKSGSEPPIFTANFLGWNPEAKKKFIDPYEAKLAAALAANPPEEAPAPPPPATPPVGASAIVSGDFKDPSGTKFDYETLKSGLVPGVDPTKKEQYLSDAEFEKVLGSPRSEFNQMKAWKQAQIKKAKGLF